MKRIYFIDLDGVVVIQGTHTLLPHALEKLRELQKDGEIWFFSCWAYNETDMDFLRGLGVSFGVLPKPYADEYIYIDDHLNTQACSTSLANPRGDNRHYPEIIKNQGGHNGKQ